MSDAQKALVVLAGVVAGALLLAGIEPASMRVYYTGDGLGEEFRVSTLFPATPLRPHTTIRATREVSGWHIGASRPAGEGGLDMVTMELGLGGHQGARIRICNGPDCARVFVVFGYDPGKEEAELIYQMVTGSIRVTHASNGRIEGRFSGTAARLDSQSGAVDHTRSIELTGGRFKARGTQ